MFIIPVKRAVVIGFIGFLRYCYDIEARMWITIILKI